MRSTGTTHLGRSGALVTAGTLVGQACAVAGMLLLASVSGPSGFGRALALLGAMTITVDAVDFGSTTGWVRRYAQAAATADGYRVVLWRKVGLLAAVLMVGLPILLIFFKGFAPVVLGAVLFVTSRSVLITYYGVAQAKGSSAALGLAMAIERAVSLALLVAAVTLRLPLDAPTLLMFTYGLGSFVAAINLRRQLGVSGWAGWREIKRPWKLLLDAPDLGLANLVPDLVGLDVLIVQSVAGSAAAGIFGLAARVTSPATVLVSGLTTPALPALAREPSLKHAVRRLSKEGWLTVLVSFCVLGVAAVAAHSLLAIFDGSAYVASAAPLRIYIAASAFVVLNQLLVVALQAQDYGRRAWQILTTGVALSLVLIAALGQAAGVEGAATGYLLANALILIALSAVAWKSRASETAESYA